MSEESKKETKKTLTDEDITSDEGRSAVGRRGMLVAIGATAVGGALAASGCGPRIIVRRNGYTGVTDADPSDGAGYGRGTRTVVVQGASGCTDSDSGYGSDAAGNGRRCAGRVIVQQGTGITDNDQGPCADPAGNGRGYSGRTDSDGGYCSDPAGRGRY
ncbi:MAG: hypothetical protein K8H88_23055 [Sandaracinaceae bacterium]|nr:hypothetical protein [Sandaracinaceae bacterium]